MFNKNKYIQQINSLEEKNNALENRILELEQEIEKLLLQKSKNSIEKQTKK